MDIVQGQIDSILVKFEWKLIKMLATVVLICQAE
jgi:hypothetical protein